jgi:hypothetical protein
VSLRCGGPGDSRPPKGWDSHGQGFVRGRPGREERNWIVMHTHRLPVKLEA